MKNNHRQRGITTSFIITLVGVILIAGAVFYYIVGRRQENTAPLQNQTQTQNQTPETQNTLPSSTVAAEHKIYTIEITANGFNPQTLEVKTGDTVTFVNKDTARHWPASDPHPEHTLCPGFDARHGLGEGESYSFTFTNAKTCTMHDHLHPSLTGTITIKK